MKAIFKGPGSWIQQNQAALIRVASVVFVEAARSRLSQSNHGSAAADARIFIKLPLDIMRESSHLYEILSDSFS